ncbi:MAG: cofactor-independent phosphoglycerate mutase [Monoglobales bacterium]
MKYLILLGDGMADLPLADYNNKTPLEIADKPNIDALAKKGIVGMVKTVPDQLSPGSDVANLSVMGYDTTKSYTGRSPLEAASIGVDLADDDMTFRCNLVTLSDDVEYENKTMVDYSAGEITTAEAAELMKSVSEHLGTDILEFYAGISYRHLLVWHGCNRKFKLTPPHDISDKKITDSLPSEPVFLEMMKKSYEFLSAHPINLDRVKRGLNPANSIWLWGEGTKPAIESFESKNGLKGSVVSAVDLVKGIGKLAGMDVIEVEGATGNLETNFEGKAKAAADKLLSDSDFVYLHYEAPDECGHHGDAEGKIKSIEYIDKRVLSYLLKRFDEAKVDFSIMILPDHPTPVATKTHSRDAIPFLIYRSNDEKNVPDAIYSEEYAKTTGLFVEEGHKLLDLFIG